MDLGNLTLAQEILAAAESEGIVSRLMGGLAVWERCPVSRSMLLSRAERSGDIDFVVSGRDRKRFERLLSSQFGLLIDPQLAQIPTEIHARFYRSDGTRVCDITYDKIVYCHTIDLRGRLDKDPVTIPLAELLLSKLQIVQPSDKDVLDTVALTTEHAFGFADGETINLSVLRSRCASDWGLEHSALLSIYHTYGRLLDMTFLNMELRYATALRLLHLAGVLCVDGKPLRWRLRSLRGAGRRWYNEVESLGDPPIEELREA